MKLLWTYADKDPIYGQLKWHGTFSGARPIHLLGPLWKKPSSSHNPNNRDIRQWDVTVKNVSDFHFIYIINTHTHTRNMFIGQLEWFCVYFLVF